MPQGPQEPLLLLCESPRVKGKGDGSPILLKCMWKWQAGLVSPSVSTSEAPDPSRMLLSPLQPIHEHRASTAMFSGLHFHCCACASAPNSLPLWCSVDLHMCLNRDL